MGGGTRHPGRAGLQKHAQDSILVLNDLMKVKLLSVQLMIYYMQRE